MSLTPGDIAVAPDLVPCVNTPTYSLLTRGVYDGPTEANFFFLSILGIRADIRDVLP